MNNSFEEDFAEKFSKIAGRPKLHPESPKLNGHDEPPPVDGPEAYGLDDENSSDVHEPPLIEAKPYEWRAPEQITCRAWLYGRHYIRRFVSTTIGRPGLGKTALAFAETLDMVSSRRILDPFDRKPLRVWYIGEDPADEIDRRIAAACAHHRIGPDDIAGRLFVASTLDLPPLRIAQQGSHGPVVNDATVDALAAQIKAKQIDVLIIDPLIKFHAVAEADPSAMEAVMRALSNLANRTAAAVEVLHHTRKQALGTAGPATVDDGRGASSIIGAVRSARVLNAMTQAEAERAGIAEGDRWRYARVDPGKSNMAPPEAARWLQHASEILPCGESIGVVAPWQFPDAFASFSANDLPRVRELARTGAYRDDPRSQDWFGKALADMIGADIDDKHDRARVSTMIKTWKKTKVLDVEMRLDAQRKDRAFIVPGAWSEAAE
jgi:AAA domain